MRLKTGFFLFIFFISLTSKLPATPDELSGQPEGRSVVALRVFQKNNFVRNLKPEDFEVLENGIPRKIESIYLVEKSQVLRLQENQPIALDVHNNYYIIVQASEYDRKLGEAVSYLINNYFQTGDSLTVITPIKVYRFNPETLSRRPRSEVSKELQNIMRTDIIRGSRDYNSLLLDLKRLTRSLVSFGGERAGADPEVENEMDTTTTQDFGIEQLLGRYKYTLEKLDGLRLVDQNKFLDFADSLKKTSGQNVVFFFYQREFRPELSPRIINQMMSVYQDYPHVLSLLMELFQFYRRENKMDKKLLGEAMSDSGALFNFIYLNKKPERITGVVMNEQSEDVFETLSVLARATGGIIDQTFNPLEGIKKSAENMSSYYLIFYFSEPSQLSPEFCQVQVNLKGRPELQVRHRWGYFPESQKY